MSTLKKAWVNYLAWCQVIDLVASASAPLPFVGPSNHSADQIPSGGDVHEENVYYTGINSQGLNDSTIATEINDIDLNGWRPLLDAHFSPSLAALPEMIRQFPEEATKTLDPGSNGELSERQILEYLPFIGTLGGVLGFFMFFESWAERIMRAIMKSLKKFPHGGVEPSWTVAIQVGLSTGGLKGSAGNFPQVCLYDAGSQLLGYTDTKISIQKSTFWKVGGKHHDKYDSPRPEGMPDIQDGGISAVGVWPRPGMERKLGTQQAPYVVLIKRHYDAICISSLFVGWPDGSKWVFDGTWARASDQSWYYSHIFDARNGDAPGECFWLEHRGTLDHTQDREEEYIHKDLNKIGRIRHDHIPKWLWASDVEQEEGLPTGADLTEGMKYNGVDQGRTPLGVKVFLPAFKATNYQSLDNLTIGDFTNNLGRMQWLTEMVNSSRVNLVLPIIHPNAEWRDPKAPLVNGGPSKIDGQHQAPPECRTDWYRDENENIVPPATGGWCEYKNLLGKWRACRKDHHKRASEDIEDRPKPIKQHFSRSLVMDKTARKNGTSTRELCEHSHSVGPSYANRLEGEFCRMTDKTVWPFCDQSKGVITDCFDEEVEVLRVKGAPSLKREVQWDSIEHWNADGKWKRDLQGDGELVLTQTLPS